MQKIRQKTRQKDRKYSLEDYRAVFMCYFQTYENYMGKPHPHLRQEQIAAIMRAMPEVQDDLGRDIDISPADYRAIIPLHFKTRYRRCDYNINHFFSGRIRTLRLYEMLQGYE